MYDTPLYSAALSYVQSGRSRFHTPGHSGKAELLKGLDALSFDLTEINGLDSLFEASGPINRAEQLASDLFGTSRTLFSAGGCTLAIQTMLALAARGGRIVAGRNLHRAAVNACALLDITPFWVYPDAQSGVIEPHDVAQALERYADISAVYVTSPDYYGRLCDIRSLSEICRNYNIPLLVDNAHGTHLKFVTQDLHPIHLGAAMTACSAHKTLPVFTGGAFLNIGDSRFSENAKSVMSIFGSTSPSYLTMASLDLCRAWLTENGKRSFSALEGTVAQIKEYAAECGVKTLNGRVDPVRITLDLAGSGIDGGAAAGILRDCGVEPEYTDDGYAVMIATPFHDAQDFDRVRLALDRIGRCERTAKDTGRAGIYEFLHRHPKQCISIKEAVFSKKEEIGADAAAGRIAAQAVCPCPPGIPAVIPGEEIDAATAGFLNFYGIRRVNVVK